MRYEIGDRMLNSRMVPEGLCLEDFDDAKVAIA